MGLSLRDTIELHLEYDDTSPFGTIISGQLDARLKRRFQPAIAMFQRNVRQAIERGPSLIAELGLDGSGGFFRSPQVLREDFTCPAPTAARPAALGIYRPNSRP